MNVFDVFIIFRWWSVFFIIGIISFPITFLFLGKLKDKGYLFSKIIGILIISYLTFIFGLFKILPFTLPTLFLLLFIFFIFNIFIFIKKRIQIEKRSYKIFLLEEILFLVTLFFWSYIRSHEPSIHGLEKFMDFGFVNSILRADYFPPRDMWFTPFSINYYYFGHFITALLTKLSNISSTITYNLMIATLFAFTFSFSFSIGINLLTDKIKYFKNILGGILIAILVTFSGNLHTIYSLFSPYNVDNPQPFWQLVASLATFPNSYWYPNATRFIPFTIHEFPLYSFVVSDLHGHVLDIPFVLLIIILLYSMFNENIIKKSKLLFISLLLAMMYMTNAWDGLIYFILSILVILFISFKSLLIDKVRNQKSKIKDQKYFENLNIKNSLEIENWKLKIKDLLFHIGILFFGFIIFTLPFNLNFKPFVSGIGVICAPSFLISLGKLGPFLFEANHCQRSAFWQLLILYGFFYFFVISFILFLKFKKIKVEKNDLFVFLIIFLSTILIIIPEFIYAKDIYPAHYRANTMFKLTYQAFIMLSIASGYIFIRLITNIKNKIFKVFNFSFIFLVFSLFFLILVMIYPLFAINSYYGKKYLGLDGLLYLKDIHPGDYKAILWINKNIEKQPVILEAQGDSYTDYERISANTGLPTILGWTVHEWLWRGTYDIPAPRIQEVKDIYESKDLNETKSLLKKYDVSYVYIGNLEKEKYLNLNEEKFNKVGKIVYQNNDVKIYKITF